MFLRLLQPSLLAFGRTIRVIAIALAMLSVPAASAGAVTLDIKMFRYQPEVVEVSPGTTVVWTNSDDIDHTITSASGTEPDDRFDSGRFGQGESFSRTFTEPGEYHYICSMHPSMTGTIRVVAE